MKFPAEIAQHKVAKPARMIIRLRHSLPADTEIHAVLPDTLDEFERAAARGELKDIKACIDKVFGTECPDQD